jgi:hypothetical protein
MLSVMHPSHGIKEIERERASLIWSRGHHRTLRLIRSKLLRFMRLTIFWALPADTVVWESIHDPVSLAVIVDPMLFVIHDHNWLAIHAEIGRQGTLDQFRRTADRLCYPIVCVSRQIENYLSPSIYSISRDKCDVNQLVRLGYIIYIYLLACIHSICF